MLSSLPVESTLIVTGQRPPPKPSATLSIVEQMFVEIEEHKDKLT
jgi:hypothetical protein